MEGVLSDYLKNDPGDFQKGLKTRALRAEESPETEK